MTSDSGESQPPARRIVLLTKVKKPPLGTMTMAFFRKGEDLEATEFANLPHDDPALVPPKLGFRSFDRVPRRWAPSLLVLLVVVSATVSVLDWPWVRGQGARAGVVLRTAASAGWHRLKDVVASRHAAP
jgi:hypothetical protein